MKKRFLDIVIVIIAVVMLFSGYKVFTTLQNAKESKEEFEQLEQLVQPEPEEETKEVVTSQQKYQYIYDKNNHFVGWLYIPDTDLSYPVMHTPSNPEYYLRKNFEGKYSIEGVPFVDYRCVIDQSDNTIIYGHNMMNGTMFGILENYFDQNYWQQHRYIGFDTMNGYGTYEVAICAKIDLKTTDFNYIELTDFESEEEFDSYISKAQSYAPYQTDVELCYGDKLLLLSTCQTNYNDGRYVIIARRCSDNSLEKAEK